MLSFSIITPNLNQGQYIASNLASISEQTHQPIEHIVLDCESTDQSQSILANFEHTKRFIHISDADNGQSDAINKGLLGINYVGLN